MAKADIIEVTARKNGRTLQYLLAVGESESKLKVVVNLIAPELLIDMGPHYIAYLRIIAKSVEVPESWLPHRIINKKK